MNLRGVRESVLILTQEDYNNDLFWALPKGNRETITLSPQWQSLLAAGYATSEAPAQLEENQYEPAPELPGFLGEEIGGASGVGILMLVVFFHFIFVGNIARRSGGC